MISNPLTILRRLSMAVLLLSNSHATICSDPAPYYAGTTASETGDTNIKNPSMLSLHLRRVAHALMIRDGWACALPSEFNIKAKISETYTSSTSTDQKKSELIAIAMTNPRKNSDGSTSFDLCVTQSSREFRNGPILHRKPCHSKLNIAENITDLLHRDLFSLVNHTANDTFFSFLINELYGTPLKGSDEVMFSKNAFLTVLTGRRDVAQISIKAEVTQYPAEESLRSFYMNESSRVKHKLILDGFTRSECALKHRSQTYKRTICSDGKIPYSIAYIYPTLGPAFFGPEEKTCSEKRVGAMKLK